MGQLHDTLPSATRGRLLILAAAVLWSLSGVFTRILQEPTPLGLNEPRLEPLQIAAGRVLFAALVLAVLLRPRDVAFRPGLIVNGVIFALMNVVFVSALALGKAANAILLQYTAPLWLYLVGVFFLREPVNLRGLLALLIGLAGIGIILYGGWEGERPGVILLGLASGVTFAAVLLGLRWQGDLSPVWLNVVNHFAAAVLLLPCLWLGPLPTWPQLGWLVLFGGVQLGLPYLIMTRGLKYVSAQEAGALTLAEPLLQPLWSYLVSPEKEKPTIYIVLGGVCILGALAYRYWPRRQAGAGTRG
jgi:drug/metabolite transporter (DMT)-like permease